MPIPSLPHTGNYLNAIRESSRALRTAHNITITQESIQRLLLSPAFTTSFKRVSSQNGLALPLRFTSYLDELNFISILSILNFASGYRVPLHEQTGRGAWDSIRAFAFSLYITSSEGDHLSAKGMQAISEVTVAELMGINIHVERPHETIQGVMLGELGGPLYELVKLITGVLNETGTILVTLSYPNLGSFVVEALKEGSRAQSKSGIPSIELEVVLERLVRAFPAFQDMAIVDGHFVYCFKKALFLIHAIHLRFSSISPLPFPIPSTLESPIFTDNVLPSMLVYLGIIDLSSSPDLSSLFPGAGLEESLKGLLAVNDTQSSSDKSGKTTAPKEGPLVTKEQSYKLRAAAVDACELIVSTARSLDLSSEHESAGLKWIRDITLPELDMWLWSVAKERPDYRALERFVDIGTVFF